MQGFTTVMVTLPPSRTVPASVELRAGSASGTAPLVDGTSTVGDLLLDVTVTIDHPGLRIDWALINPGTAPVALDEVRMRFHELRPRRAVERGWTTSSPVRSARPGDLLLPLVAARDHADAARAGQALTAHQVLVHDRGVIGLLDGRSELGIVETPTARAALPGTAVVVLLDGIELDPGQRRPLPPVWMAEGSPDALVAPFHERWAEHCAALSHQRVPLGWWADPHLTERAMAAGIELAGLHGLHHAVVDITAASIRELPGQLRRAGLRPALRLRPFALGPRGPLAAHAVERAPGRPVVVDTSLVADLTDPIVLDQLRQRFVSLRSAGWEQFVLEGVWLGALAGRRRGSRTTTRAEALRQGLEAIRDGAGNDAVITVTDSPAGPAVGIAQRVVTGTLSAAGQASVLHHAVEHRRLWAAGPSALDLGPSGGVSASRSAVELAAAVGGCAWLGGDLTTYDELSWALAAYLLDVGGAVDSPLVVSSTVDDLPTVVAPDAGTTSTPLRNEAVLASGHPAARSGRTVGAR